MISVLYVLTTSISFIGSYYNSSILKISSLVMIPIMLYKGYRRQNFNQWLLRQALFFIIPITGCMLITPLLAFYKTGSMSIIYAFAGEKQLFYQLVCILTVVAALYVLEEKAIWGTVIAAIIAGVYAGVRSLIKYGVQASFSSVRNLVISVMQGDTAVSGFVADLEMHDYTILLGLLILFLIFHEKGWSATRLGYILAMAVFFFLGYCRIACIAMVAGVLLELLRLTATRCSETIQLILIFFVAAVAVVVSFIYLRMIFNGSLNELINQYQIQTNGRSTWWFEEIVEKVNFSPGYVGGGIGYYKVLCDAEIHNDLLRQYIDLGYAGFLAWIIYEFILQPILIARYISMSNLWRYVICTVFIFITYMTDNTMFYYNTMFVYYMVCMVIIRPKEKFQFKQIEDRKKYR